FGSAFAHASPRCPPPPPYPPPRAGGGREGEASLYSVGKACHRAGRRPDPLGAGADQEMLRGCRKAFAHPPNDRNLTGAALLVAQRRIKRLRGLGEDPVLVRLRQARDRSASDRQQVLERTFRGRVVGPPCDPWGAEFTDQLGKECLRRCVAVAAFRE